MRFRFRRKVDQLAEFDKSKADGKVFHAGVISSDKYHVR